MRTTDIVVIILSSTVGLAIVALTIGTVAGKVINPQLDTARASEVLSNLLGTLVGALVGFVSGRAAGRNESSNGAQPQ